MAVLNRGGIAGAPVKPNIEKIQEKPISVTLVQCAPETSGLLCEEQADEISIKVGLPQYKSWTVFRGAPLSRLPVILETGIDVEPSDAVFYGAEFEKALEYGDWPKVILALDGYRLTKTFKEISADASTEELTSIRKIYPTILTSKDGTKLWCSRLAETDRGIAGPYEANYAWWIEGEGLSALKGITVLCAYEDTETYFRIKGMFGDG